MSRAVPGARTFRAPSFPGALLLATALVAGCIKGEVGGAPVPPITHPDLNCNTSQDALANAECRLQLKTETTEYIQQPGDKDWWVINVGTLPPRAIVHVVAGYKPGAGQDAGSFNTAVNFQINVLDSLNGAVSNSLATGVDQHGSNSPTVLDLTFRYTKSNNDLYILVQDDNGREYDNLSPYTLFVEVVPDPDANEANDTPATATPIPLTPGTNGGVQGNNGGFLSTPGDVDYFSIASPNPNSVMWIRVGQDPAFPSPPPHRYRLEYFLRDPGGTVVATDSSTAGSLVSPALVQIGTARLLSSTGTYTLQVRGYIDPNNQTVIPPGDLAFKYKVEVIIVPLQDPAEPNNTIADAKGKASPDLTLAGAGSSGSITGRISFVPDPDYYRVRLGGASAVPHLLHYRVTPSAVPARFPPVPGAKDRLLYITTEVAAGSEAACSAGDAGVCIISAPQNNYNYPIATNLCLASTPQCLQSARYENHDATPKFPLLSNFEGVLQVPPHGANQDYFLLFEDEGTNWADDTDYQILVEWLAEPEPALEAIPEAQRPATAVGGGPNTPLTGFLSYGIGATDTSLGIAPITDVKDYDGRGDDVDTYAVDVPVGVVADARLFFQWRIPSASLTGAPYDLGIRLGFCVPDGGVDCATVQTRTQNGGSQLGLIYETAPVTSWWNFAPQATPLEPAYDRTYSGVMPTGTVLTVLRDYACGCLEKRLVPASGTAKMFISVFPINRQTWDTGIPYTVETGFGAVPSYPYSFTANGGATVSCPAVCNFTKN
ncbi:MAG TPA: hypothetical protein VFE93_16625 [Myxococcaceae bacterium]|nr:hypothetical protein [Myxococcaceae bacterium]